VNQHTFRIRNEWKGNLGTGTSRYNAYSRNHEIYSPGKSIAIPGSSDPQFRGDGSRYNPEELLVASLSTCHMLWMLHLCADAGIVIDEYSDQAEGVMQLNPDGSGQFSSVTLRPALKLADPSRTAEALELHHRAHELCFIARSVNFEVSHQPLFLP
jgi:organic hydroperoxide reductase OsmC/OhrA